MARKLTSLIEPISFPISPAISGLNTGVNARAIDMRETPDAGNVRGYKGQITTRTGYKGKYFGGRETILLLEYVYATDGSQTIIALSGKKPYQIQGTSLLRIPIYTGGGTGTFQEGGSALDVFALNAAVAWWSSTTGKTRIQGFDINGGAIWPNSSDFGDLRVVASDSDGIFIIAQTGNGIEGEKLTARSGTAPLSARALAFYGGRLVAGAPKGAGGFALNAYLQWSAVGRADLWAAADGGGSQLIGDESDGIQALSKIGEYLIVFKERGIYIGNQTLNPNQPFYFVPAPNQAIGMSAPLTIGELGEEQIFLGWDNIYRFGLSGITPIGDKIKRDLLYGADGIVPSFINRCVGIIAEEFDEYWLFVPTGKSPSYKVSGADIPNWCPNPTMALAEISASTTLSSNVLSNISATDIALIKVNDGVSGTGIPVGCTVVSIGASSIVISSVATQTTLKNKILVSPVGSPNNQWTALSDGPIAFTYGAGGVFGMYYNSIEILPPSPAPSVAHRRLKRPPFVMWRKPQLPILHLPATVSVPGGTQGTYVTLRSGIITFSGSIQGHDLSVLAWIRANGPCNVKLTINQENSTKTYTRNLSLITSSVFQPYVFDSIIQPGGGEQHFTIDIELDTPTVRLDVSAVQVVDLGSRSGDYVDSTFIDQSQGYNTLAIKGVSGPEMIPFVIDSIGTWACDTVWVYNYTDESWWRWRLPVNGFGFDALNTTVLVANLVGAVSDQTWRFDEKLLVALAPTNLISPSDGQVYELSRSYDKDYQGLLDRAILNYWVSKDFDVGRPDLDKTLSRVVIHHDASHPPTVMTVSASSDAGATWVDQTITIRQGHTETFADFFVTGSQVRFKVTASAGLFIDGFSVKIIARGETNAY